MTRQRVRCGDGDERRAHHQDGEHQDAGDVRAGAEPDAKQRPDERPDPRPVSVRPKAAGLWPRSRTIRNVIAAPIGREHGRGHGEHQDDGPQDRVPSDVDDTLADVVDDPRWRTIGRRLELAPDQEQAERRDRERRGVDRERGTRADHA